MILRHRLPGWRTSFRDYIAATKRRAFRPGEFDCALFAAGNVKALTGVDLSRGLRGYRSIAEGRRKLKARGFESAVDLAAHHFAEISAALAMPGDLAEMEDDLGDPALAVVQGEKLYVLRPSGLGLMPLTTARRAFAI